MQSYIKEIRKKGRRYFTIGELMSDLSLSKNAALAITYRLRRCGDIISPAKGLYVIVPPERQSYGCISAMELTPILMKHLNIKYYVALLSAAEFHGATHQKPARFQIVTNKLIKHPLEFGQIKLEIIYKKSLDGVDIMDFPVSTGYLKVANPELTAYDLLHYSSRRSGGLNHIATVFSEIVESLDADKLIKLAEKIREVSWLQKLGFILDQIDVMDEEKKSFILEALQKFLEKKSLRFIPLANELPIKGFPYSRKWKIIENTSIESDL